jgi:hypothetical protein
VEDRRVFYCTIAFDNPMEAQLSIAARDEAHCKQLLEEQFRERKNLRIIDIFDAVALEKMQIELEAAQGGQKLIHADFEDVTDTDQPKKVLN